MEINDENLFLFIDQKKVEASREYIIVSCSFSSFIDNVDIKEEEEKKIR